MAKEITTPRIGAHVPTSGGMATRSIEYAQTIKAEVIQVFASSPRTWATSAPNPAMDEAFKTKTGELDIETYVHALLLLMKIHSLPQSIH
jgi:deoxyribonuclease IV